MKLSIIIPVYNVEKYISQCLDSVLEQDIPYSEYEVIVVNDGSSDNSAAIVAEYEKKYPNIIYINKDNGGPSSARNAGIKVAKGDYIWFIDSDDWIEKNCLKNLLEYAYNNNLDFCEFGYTEVFADNSHYSPQNNIDLKNIISNTEYLAQYIFPNTPWRFIFKRKIIIDKRLYFTVGIYNEDLEFNIRLLAHCNRISYYHSSLNSLYYYICEREDSIMGKKNLGHIKKRIVSYIKILQMADKNFPYSKNVKDYAFYLQNHLNQIIAYSLVFTITHSAIPNKARFYRKVMKQNGINYRFDVLSGKAKIKFSMLSLVKNNYYLTVLVLNLFDKVGTALKKLG